MRKALKSRPCRHNSSMQKSESMLEGSNLSNQFPTSFNNLSNPSPRDLTTSNETTIIATTVKEDEEATKATLATMVATMAMATILVAKAKITNMGGDIPTTRISPVSYMEGDTVPTSASHSRSRLANSSRHLVETSKTSNETRTATTSPTSPIAITTASRKRHKSKDLVASQKWMLDLDLSH